MQQCIEIAMHCFLFLFTLHTELRSLKQILRDLPHQEKQGHPCLVLWIVPVLFINHVFIHICAKMMVLHLKHHCQHNEYWSST